MNQTSAYNDFIRAHRKAGLQQVLSSITGKSDRLLAYSEVLSKLQTQGQVDRGLREIPLSSIIGSVGRYNDFNRDFLPRQISDKDRWARVKMAFESLEGVPPIEVYQIDEVYFVKDGNHRVSVARELGNEFIEAYVVEVKTRVPITAETQPDELILKAEYVQFLEKTGIDRIYSDIDFSVTVPGGHAKLYEHICVHQYYMGIDFNREIPLSEAVVHWFETVYSPVIEVIKGEAILREFPNRTETDLYLWLLDYQAELQEELGWQIDQEKAAKTLAERFSNRFENIFRRAFLKIRNVVIPGNFETGPAIGSWRLARQRNKQSEAVMFRSILVSLQDTPSGWQVFEQAISIAQLEHAKLSALHIIENENQRNNLQTKSLQEKFNHRLFESNLQGSLAIETGMASNVIIERARWCDLIIVNLAHAPVGAPMDKFRSGFHALIQKVGQPILAVPGEMRPLKNALLAYDGSPKANEALYLVTYLAKKWRLEVRLLTVFSEDSGSIQTEARAHQYAMDYLTSHGVIFSNMLSEGDPAQGILSAASEFNADLILMGSYGYSPLLEVFLGSAIDQVLENTRCPVLICR